MAQAVAIVPIAGRSRAGHTNARHNQFSRVLEDRQITDPAFHQVMDGGNRRTATVATALNPGFPLKANDTPANAGAIFRTVILDAKTCPAFRPGNTPG